MTDKSYQKLVLVELLNSFSPTSWSAMVEGEVVIGFQLENLSKMFSQKSSQVIHGHKHFHVGGTYKVHLSQ